ncbi:YceD family protein [Clostridium massiliodielmoense]|uniref:YceD family protein n=1 Tax=Clostridium massiliodielmoense TaxID=1776385 RepID=UPI0004D74D62|nr:DUF177 domain-containing protein [Clostridium massiliodielmoense]KEH97944.1 DNA-binding protein [Clostridium botulinum C/D str. BKT12695]
MHIDISDLLGKRVTEKKVDVSFEGKDIIFEGEEISFMEPVNIKGTFKLTDRLVNFQGTLSTNLSLTCSRCLEKFNYPLEIEVNEEFSKQGNDKDNDIIIINSDRVDFEPIIETNIILSLPMKRLCSEDCKGLCLDCGTNLNHSKCDCKENDIDPRLAQLRDFFSNN